MTVRWGLLAAGVIAHAFARGLAQTESGRAVAVAARSEDSAREFAAQYGIERAYGDYQALLDDPAVDAVYISTTFTQSGPSSPRKQARLSFVRSPLQ